MDYFSYLCNIHQNIKIMRIKNHFKMNMTMKENIVNPLSIEEALELSKESIIPITDYWENDINHSSFNNLPFGIRMPKGLVTQAEEERRKGRYGYLSDLIPSCGGSAATYFPGKITDPIEKFNAKHFPDGREKNMAVTHIE